MQLRYPNLELMEYICQEQHVKDYGKRGLFKVYNMFAQTWGNTITAFDVDKKGLPTIGGCAMTDAYTVIFHESTEDYYIVFVDDRPCYKVSAPIKDQFFDDIRDRHIASLSESKNRY